MYQNNGQKIVATVEVRMTSSRLPGKVLLPLAGKPALERLIERLKRSKYIDEIVVATTVNDADQSIVELAQKLGVSCFRGSEDDVLSRVLGAAQSVNGDIICEVTGDCPALDYRLIDQGIEDFFTHDVHYVGNVYPSTYPIGFDVQVFPTKVLEEVNRLTQDPLDHTHVSYYIYMHPDRFKVRMWKSEGEYNWPELRVTLDEKADYEFVNAIFEKLIPENEDFSALDVIHLLKKEPQLLEINKHVRQKDLSEG